MAKRPTDFARENTEQAMEVATYGINLMRELAEWNLEQSNRSSRLD
jgi:hypothetical protein